MNVEKIYEIYTLHKNISTDSRKIDKNCLFFALKGESFNGNKFANDALKKGAAFAIIDEQEYVVGDRTILVDDVLETLQKLARFHREKIQFPVIGITGSNGKTTTKELIYTVLKEKYKAFATQGNLNNHIGVPLTLLAIPLDAEIAVVEMGANHIGEIKNLCNIARPDYGIITNIGKAHIEGFGSYEGVKKAKNELYDFIRENNSKVFVNADDQLLMSLSEGIEKITYGENAQQGVSAKEVIVNEDGFLSLNCLIKDENLNIKTQLTGIYNVPNILASCCIADYFSVDHSQIKEAIEKYKPQNNRSQLKKTERNSLILDAYNANPESMKVALRNFFSFQTTQKKFAILGDMLELGHISKDEHQHIINHLKANNFDLNNVIFVGSEYLSLGQKNEIHAFKNVDEAIEFLKAKNVNDKLILIKGSRGIRLEKTVEYL